MLSKYFSLLIPVILVGCSSEIGEHYRDIADYEYVKSRFPPQAVQHFPDSAPGGSKMYGYFMPLQGSDGLQLSVAFDQSEFDSLFGVAKTQGYDSAIGIDENDPETLLHGKMSPRILLGYGDPEIPNPKDHIITIQKGPPISYGMIFRTDKQIVVYWIDQD